MTGRGAASGGRRVRRERGSGSISAYSTRAGKRWRYEIEIPIDPRRPDDGTRSVSRAGFATYTDAEAGLTLLRADTLRGVPPLASRDTFGEYGRRWLEGHPVENGTRLFIQRVLDAMDPYIGSMPMTDIRPTDLAAAYRGLENGSKQIPSPKRRRTGLASSTVARYANWVNSIFLAAVDEGLVHKNPASSKHAGRPRGESAKRVKPFVIWNVEQLTDFCAWALAQDEPFARVWVLLSRTGLRSGEVLALQWGDLDTAKNEMRIARALHYDETLPLGERYVVGKVKGGRPRTVTYDQTSAHLLKEWRNQVPALLAGGLGNASPLHGLRAHNPVFPGLPGRAATQSGLHSTFQRVQRRYLVAHPERDLPALTVHELRHTHASLLFEAGQSVKVVQERLGHASAQVTLNTYAHLLHDAQSRAATALDDLLERRVSNGTAGVG
ncbi:tyrosine-type recombinase/integrase [Nocardioides marmotae]|uniref:tyrosine-type recombinase/integrase n=1 Tax=Nocardioides marmotae TaxID=2663857 RepID=UPI0012B64421|nr:site-specific integrase [Nocardioides marmotae]MBC9733859.1 site-specific integrase [Nocardioides marmotae]MTB84962.1 tyrosine-type recombinase/integrase [Nocardioides marmotae]